MPSATPYRDRIEPLQPTPDLLALQTPQWWRRHGYGLSHAPARHRLERRGRVGAGREVSGHDQRVKPYRVTAGGKRQLASERPRRGQLSEASARAMEPRGEGGEA